MFENKGCQAVLYVIGGLTVIGLLYTGTCSSMMPWAQPQAQNQNVALVAELDGKKVGSDDVLKVADVLRRDRPTNGDPRQEFRLTVDALDQSLTLIAIDGLAKLKGASADDKTIAEYVENDFRERAARVKASYIATKKLKPDATDAEFEAVFKKDPQAGGKTFDEIKKAAVEQGQTLANDPENGAVFRAQVLVHALTKAYAASVEATPEAYKKSTESFETKSLPFDDVKVPLDERKATADKALADLKGGMKFPDAIKKYAPKKPDIALPMPRALVEASPELAPILSIKPGQVSDVIVFQGNPTIYIVDSVKANVPPDFDKKQKFYLDTYKTSQATKQLGKDLEEVKKSVKWHSDVCRLSFELGVLESKGPTEGIDAFHAALRDIASKLKDAKPTDLLGAKLQAMAKFEAFETVFSSSKPEEKKEMRAERSEMIRDVLSDTESVVLRLELFDNEAEAGNFEAAGEALVDAAKNNTGSDPIAIDLNQQITTKLEAARTAKKIDTAVLDAVQKEIDNFKKGILQAEQDKEDAAKNAAKVDDELKKLDEGGSGGQSKGGTEKKPQDAGKGAGK
ncbi:MAG: hypothetical protein JST30_02265 [Armatimonadetes bacterium]|nr:hypothetical protein [Armatimonadota bacterium]